MATNKNGNSAPTSNKLTVSGVTKSHQKVTSDKPQGVVKVPYNVTLDFSKCTAAEIMELAKDGVIVKLQARTRNKFFAADNIGKDKKTPIKGFAKIMDENMSGVIDVKASIVEQSRAPGKSLDDKFMENWAKLTPAQKKAKLAELATK